MLYDSQTKKVLKIIETENQTTLNITKLKKISYLLRPENFRKEVSIVNVISGFNIQSGTTKPDGFVNPLVTILSGIPQLLPSLPIYPIFMDFSILGVPVTIPNVAALVDTTILFVNNSLYAPVPIPDTDADMDSLIATVTPNTTNTPVPLQTPLVYLGSGIFSATIRGSVPDTELAITDLTSLTLNVNGVSVTMQVIPNTTPSAPLPGTNQPSINLTPDVGSNVFQDLPLPLSTMPTIAPQIDVPII
jgi:hypothetical protein